MSAVLESAQFPTVIAALFFAYRREHENYQASLINRMAASSLGQAGKGLGGLDGAAMAGSIKRQVLSLGADFDAVIRARYVHRTQPCTNHRCYGGTEETKEFEHAIEDVMYFVQREGVVSGISHYRFKQGVIRRHFGSKVHIGDLRLKCGIAERTAGEHIHKLKTFLGKKEGAAIHAISIDLMESGMVRSAED